ncbi:hypothetical protein [Streptomyces xiamenensis]|uniref:hypothetical protein n=1 Tax=Streptomyces xiamenensis TaxID=408015 RepID=UPI0035E2BD7A
MKSPKLGDHITVTLHNGDTYTGGVTRWPRGGSSIPVSLDHQAIGPRYAVRSWPPATDSKPRERYRFTGHIYERGRLVHTVLGATQQAAAIRIVDFFIRQRSDSNARPLVNELSAVDLGKRVSHPTGGEFQLTALG